MVFVEKFKLKVFVNHHDFCIRNTNSPSRLVKKLKAPISFGLTPKKLENIKNVG